MVLGSPCAGYSLTVLDEYILLHWQRRLLRSLLYGLRYIIPRRKGHQDLAFRVGQFCILMWFYPPSRTGHWACTQLRLLQATASIRRLLRAMVPLGTYTITHCLWLHLHDIGSHRLIYHLPARHLLSYFPILEAPHSTDDRKPTLRLSSVARWSQRRRLQRTLSRRLSPLEEYQLASSYRGMQRMYAPYQKRRHWVPPSPLSTSGRGGGPGDGRARRSSKFTGSYSETDPVPPDLPKGMKFLKGVSGLGKVGIGNSRLQERFGPGVGSGLFATAKLLYKEGSNTTRQTPICSYRSTNDLKIDYPTFKSYPNMNCTYVWSQPLPKDGSPPPRGWVCIDASDPSSCYGRYANDPFDDTLVNAKLEYDPKTDTVNLYPMREILRGEEIYISYGAGYWNGFTGLSQVAKTACLDCYSGISLPDLPDTVPLPQLDSESTQQPLLPSTDPTFPHTREPDYPIEAVTSSPLAFATKEPHQLVLTPTRAPTPPPLPAALPVYVPIPMTGQAHSHESPDIPDTDAELLGEWREPPLGPAFLQGPSILNPGQQQAHSLAWSMNDSLSKPLSKDFIKEVSYYIPGNCDMRVGTLNSHGLGLSDTSSGMLKLTNIVWFFLAADLDFLFLQDTQHLEEDGIEAFHKLGTILPPGYQFRQYGCDPLSKQRTGGQLVLISPRWSARVDDTYKDPSKLGLLFGINIHGTKHKFQLLSSYWPVPPTARTTEHSNSLWSCTERFLAKTQRQGTPLEYLQQLISLKSEQHTTKWGLAASLLLGDLNGHWKGNTGSHNLRRWAEDHCWSNPINQACESAGIDLITYGHNHSGTLGTLPDHILALGTHPSICLTGLHTYMGSFFSTDYFSDHLPLIGSFQLQGGVDISPPHILPLGQYCSHPFN